MPVNRESMSGRLTASDIGATLRLSLPLSLGYLGEITIGVTDTIMLGRLGPDALGAAGLASSIYAVIVMVGIGMLFPVMVLISQARGVGRSGMARGIIRQGLWVAGMLSVPSCAILWRLEDILLFTGQNPVLARMAGHYMDYYLWTITYGRCFRYSLPLCLCMPLRVWNGPERLPLFYGSRWD